MNLAKAYRRDKQRERVLNTLASCWWVALHFAPQLSPNLESDKLELVIRCDFSLLCLPSSLWDFPCSRDRNWNMCTKGRFWRIISDFLSSNVFTHIPSHIVVFKQDLHLKQRKISVNMLPTETCISIIYKGSLDYSRINVLIELYVLETSFVVKIFSTWLAVCVLFWFSCWTITTIF
jgi:hypothetical protein